MALASVWNRQNIYWQIVDLLKNHACIPNYINLPIDIVFKKRKNLQIESFFKKRQKLKLGLKTTDMYLSFTGYKITIKIS